MHPQIGASTTLMLPTKWIKKQVVMHPQIGASTTKDAPKKGETYTVVMHPQIGASTTKALRGEAISVGCHASSNRCFYNSSIIAP